MPKLMLTATGFLSFERFTDHIIHTRHELRRPGKALGLRRAHLYHNQLRFPAQLPGTAVPRCLRRFPLRSRLPLSRAPLISPARNDPVPLSFFRLRQRRIDFFPRKFRAGCISLRRTAGDCLVPQRRDPRRAVLIAESRMRVINPAVYDPDQDPLSHFKE